MGDWERWWRRREGRMDRVYVMLIEAYDELCSIGTNWSKGVLKLMAVCNGWKEPKDRPKNSQERQALAIETRNGWNDPKDLPKIAKEIEALMNEKLLAIQTHHRSLARLDKRLDCAFGPPPA